MDAVYVDFLSKLAATLIGALVGVLGGFWLDRRQVESKQKKEGKAILEALHNELSHDSSLLNQMCDELPNGVIFYNLDLSTWQATTGKQLESLRNYELVRRISGMYYEFQHLNRKVDVQFEIHFSSTRTFSRYSDLRREIVGPILVHAAELQPHLVKLISDIKVEVEKL